MATLFTDNFNRANSSSLGSNWTEDAGDASIVSNQLNDVSSSAIGHTTTSAHAATADVKVQFVKVANSDIGGVTSRVQGASFDTYYLLYTASGGVSNSHDFYRFPSVTLIGTRTGTLNNGDTVRFETQGSTLRMFINGTQVGTNLTDSNITAAGQCGYYMDTNSMKIDDFQVDDFTAAGSAKQTGIFSPAVRCVGMGVGIG